MRGALHGAVLAAELLDAQSSRMMPYDLTLAQSDSWFNQALDCHPPSVANWTCGLACDQAPTLDRRVVADKKMDTMALVARTSPSECIVVFRGTKNFMNTLEDLDFFPKAWPGCKGCNVHSGFYADWKALEPMIAQHLATLGCVGGGSSSSTSDGSGSSSSGRSSSGSIQTPGSAISVVGHSLGAAMACLQAFQMAGDPAVNIRRVYTYGQPRTGNVAFADAFDARMRTRGVVHYRVTNYRDPVPHLPLENFLFEGWKHTGNEVYYNATQLQAYKICPLAGDQTCSDKWNLLQAMTHVCDHCSYYGMNPCNCGSTTPDCVEPRSEWYDPLARIFGIGK